MDVYGATLILGDKRDGIFYMSEATLREDVIFMKVKILGTIHIKLCNSKSLRHHL